MALIPRRYSASPAPQSPEWWLNKLSRDLQGRQTDMDLMDRYYTGDHPLPFLTKSHESKIRSEFRMLLEDSRANFMRLVVDAVEERMKVEGIRLSGSSDPVSDGPTWEIWQANHMDAESQSAFLEALIKGISYFSVWKNAGDKYPTIAVEDPTQTIVGYVPGSNYRQRAAALKVWTDEWTGMRRANVFMPDGIYKFQRKADATDSTAYASQLPSSQSEQPPWKQLDGTDGFLKNPLGVVPVVPMRNRPRVLIEGESELADVFRIQNSINGFLFLLAIAGYFGAHRQRWVTGIALMEDGNGRPMEPFDSSVDRLWAVEGAGEAEVKFGEFEQTDLEGYIKSIEQKVLHIAVTTRTPRHYLFQEGQSPSGDAIESAESGLVAKVERKHRPYGEALEEVLGLARRFDGETDTPVDSEIIWGSAKTESIATVTDGVIKQFEANLIPWEAALEKLGYSQTQIQRFSKMRLSDSLLQGIANPAPPDPIKVVPPTVVA